MTDISGNFLVRSVSDDELCLRQRSTGLTVFVELERRLYELNDCLDGWKAIQNQTLQSGDIISITLQSVNPPKNTIWIVRKLHHTV